jgi:DNA modification methylase
MGGGKTHSLIAFGLLASDPGLRHEVVPWIGAGNDFGAARVVIFNGHQNPENLFWGHVAERLERGAVMAPFWRNGAKTPGVDEWANVLGSDPVLILLDELPSYLQMAQGEPVGATTLGDLTIGALERLFNALPRCPRACVVVTNLKDDVYLDGSNQLRTLIDSLTKHYDRNAQAITPVQQNSAEVFAIVRKRLFDNLPADVERVLDGQLADMTFTDPPYNVDYANSPKDKLRGKHRPILNDDLGTGFEAFLHDACVNIVSVTKGAVYICMSSSELHTLQRAFAAAGGKWSTFVIWAKHTFTLGRSDYQRQYEPILYGWPAGHDRYLCGARDQGDVWFVDKPARNDLHPTMKPVTLIERAVRNSSKSRDIVLDPFGGSGSTLIACEKVGRQARLVELDPKYCDVIVMRWQEFSGGAATLDGDGRSYEEIARAREAA